MAFLEQVRDNHKGNVTCIVEDAHTGKGLRIQYVSVSTQKAVQTLTGFHSVILASSLWKHNPLKLDSTFGKRFFRSEIPR